MVGISDFKSRFLMNKCGKISSSGGYVPREKYPVGTVLLYAKQPLANTGHSLFTLCLHHVPDPPKQVTKKGVAATL